MGPEGVVGRHIDFDGLVEGVELAILGMVVVAPVAEHVAWVGDGLHLNGARIEIHAGPGKGARRDGVDSDVSSPVRRGVQRHAPLEREVEAFNQMDA